MNVAQACGAARGACEAVGRLRTEICMMNTHLIKPGLLARINRPGEPEHMRIGVVSALRNCCVDGLRVTIRSQQEDIDASPSELLTQFAMPTLNKQDRLEDYKRQTLNASEFNWEWGQVIERHELTTDEWKSFERGLLTNREWLAEKGGAATLNAAVADIPPQKMTRADMDAFRHGAYLLLLEVVSPEGELVYVDPEGYNYARYVGFSQAHMPKVAPTKLEALPVPEEPAGGSVEITHNEAKHGIEIRFSEKPSQSVLDRLKAHGWRWSRFAKCWYHRNQSGVLPFACALRDEFTGGERDEGLAGMTDVDAQYEDQCAESCGA